MSIWWCGCFRVFKEQRCGIPVDREYLSLEKQEKFLFDESVFTFFTQVSEKDSEELEDGPTGRGWVTSLLPSGGSPYRAELDSTGNAVTYMSAKMTRISNGIFRFLNRTVQLHNINPPPADSKMTMRSR